MDDSEPYESCLKTLGLSGPVGRKDLQRAYKRLAKRLHPDHHPEDPDARSTFHRVTEAYAKLKDLYDHGNKGGRIGVCSRCDKLDRLGIGAQGQPLCPACLLYRRRLLPGPVHRAIRGWLVILLQIGAIAAAWRGMYTNDRWYAVASVIAAVAAFLALLAACRDADLIEK